MLIENNLQIERILSLSLRKTYWKFGGSVLGLLATTSVLSAAQSANSVEFFETRIRPLLAEKCFACHTQSRLGGLQIDSRETFSREAIQVPPLFPVVLSRAC